MSEVDIEAIVKARVAQRLKARQAAKATKAQVRQALAQRRSYGLTARRQQRLDRLDEKDAAMTTGHIVHSGQCSATGPYTETVRVLPTMQAQLITRCEECNGDDERQADG
jgi:DnaJ-class molecular chaperone